MGNGLSQCAWTDGWAGYASSRTYYPPNYPQPPAQRVSPSRCFGTPTEAVIAGYRPAPTPSGYLLVGDIYLEPAGQALARGCAKAARGVAGSAGVRGAVRGYTYYQPNYAYVSNYRQITNLMAAGVTDEKAMRDQTWKNIDDSSSQIRRKMTAKYQVEF